MKRRVLVVAEIDCGEVFCSSCAYINLDPYGGYVCTLVRKRLTHSGCNPKRDRDCMKAEESAKRRVGDFIIDRSGREL